MLTDTRIRSDYMSGTYFSKVLPEALVLYYIEAVHGNDLGKKDT